GTFCNTVLSFTAGSPTQKASFESNNYNLFKRFCDFTKLPWRGDNGLEIYVMCEIPNNVILIDTFAKLFDGFSIGSNDLTQLILGVDRDSEIVAFDFDERDAGVKEMIRLAVEGAKRNGRHSGICGQAPSDYPEMAEYLVEIGIDAMSLNPDTVLNTIRHVLAVEKRLSGRPKS
ncbi:MAG: putative PEP-binding protein, partial [Methylocella sp.]